MQSIPYALSLMPKHLQSVNIIYTRYLQAQYLLGGVVLWRAWPEGDTHLSQEAQSDEHPLRQ